jgi:hypothetical protein
MESNQVCPAAPPGAGAEDTVLAAAGSAAVAGDAARTLAVVVAMATKARPARKAVVRRIQGTISYKST